MTEESEKDRKIYEVGYLLLPTVPEENIGKEYGNIKESIERLGGEVISDEIPRVIALAYTVEKMIGNVRSKFNTAYFSWIKFSMDPEKVSELKKNLREERELLRFLIFKTVKENTIAAKRFVRDIPYRRPLPGRKKEEAAVPIDKEKIDKEIEAMVAD